MQRFIRVLRDDYESVPNVALKSLHEVLLDGAWSNLAPAIQRAHPRELPIERSGRFDISHGRGFLARFLARWSKIPPAGRALPTRLRVERKGSSEVWRRNFGSFPLVSTQQVSRAGTLVERFGGIEFCFKVQSRDSGIQFRQIRAAICIGRCKLPLPAWLGPRVDAQEMPGDLEYQTRVRVTVRLPLIGLLINYQGEIDQPEFDAKEVVSK